MKKLKPFFLIPFIWIIFFANPSYTIRAQVVHDTIVASQHLKKGDSLLIQRKHNKSIAYLKKAIPIYKKVKKWEKVARCYNGISENQWQKYEDKKSLLNAKKALEISAKYLDNSIEEAVAYDNIGIYYQYTSDYEIALNNYKKALAIKLTHTPKSDKAISTSYSRIGTIYFIKGEYEKSLLFQEKCLSMDLKSFGENHKEVSYVYNEIGRVYIAKKEYQKALEYFKKALTIFSNSTYKANSQMEAASSINNIGVALRGKKKYKKSLEYYNRALQIYLKLYGDNYVRVSNSYYNIGLIHHDLKEYEKAIKYYNKALTIRLDKLGKNHSHVANSYLLLGWSYYEKKEYEKALINYKKSLDISLNLSSPNPTMIATLYLFTGNVFDKKEEFNKALHYYQLALKTNSVLNKINAYNSDHFFDLNIVLETLLNKAKTLQNSYRRNNNLQTLKHSINAYKKVDTVIKRIRQEFGNQKDKITFAKKAKETYAGAIKTQLSLYSSQNNQNSLNQAFYYTEKSKANILKELLNNSNAITFSGLPLELIKLEKKLKTDFAFYQSRINKGQSLKTLDTVKNTLYENKLFDINRQQDSLTRLLEKNYPKYYQLKYKNEIVTVTDIQQQLDDKTTVLEFFTEDSITYAFTISKNDITAQELSTPKLTEQVEEFRKSITTKNTIAFKQKAHDLYNQLITPVADKLVGDNLIIIPDGSLWHLNFELLLTQNDDSNNPALLSYLLRDYTITYANSANLLFDTFKSHQESKTLQECLAFSFSDSTQIAETRAIDLETLRDAGEDLPGTRKEIRAISNIIDGQYYFGSQAIEANFKKNAGQYNILHLALHGDVDNEHPENSKLYFTKNKDTLEDNLLYSHELFALDIPAELTVLSACNTGTGKIAKGEGIMSLGTAFQYAGTKSLLLTSWEVSDQTTPELMTYFYTNIKKGMNKAKALQQAKLQYLATANINRTAPFYWGGFYLVGDSAPIHFNDNTLLYWILGIGVLGMLLLGIFWYQRKVKKKN